MRSFPFALLLPVITCCVAAMPAGFATDHAAIMPVPRDERWLGRHQGFVETARRGGIDVLFLGDSITDRWRRPDPAVGGKTVWDEYFAPLRAANFGLGGDQTQHVLWRITHGEIDGLAPRVVVLLIGTNNSRPETKDRTEPRNTPAETADGITAIVRELRTRLPQAKILLLAIFPRGEPDDPIRARIAATNALIARLHDGRQVHFLDINREFLQPDGRVSTEIMPDLLHLNGRGYAIWAKAVHPHIVRLLRTEP